MRNFSLNVQVRMTYAQWLISDWIKLLWSYTIQRSYFMSFLAKQVCFGPVKTRNMYRFFLEKVQLLSTFCNNFSQPATTWFVARQVWFVFVKMRNIVIQLVLQQCCKSSCTFLLAVLPSLKQDNVAICSKN